MLVFIIKCVLIKCIQKACSKNLYSCRNSAFCCMYLKLFLYTKRTINCNLLEEHIYMPPACFCRYRIDHRILRAGLNIFEIVF